MAGPFRAGQVLHGSDNRTARQRLRTAATGRGGGVLVSSGDPGVFAMAAAVLEALHGAGEPAWDAVELRISLASRRPWPPPGRGRLWATISPAVAVRQPQALEVIERRLDLAAPPMAMAFYNPISRARPWQLDGRWRSSPPSFAADPWWCSVATSGGPASACARTTLGELRAEQVDMRTLVIIGSSTTCSFRACRRRSLGHAALVPTGIAGRERARKCGRLLRASLYRGA